MKNNLKFWNRDDNRFSGIEHTEKELHWSIMLITRFYLANWYLHHDYDNYICSSLLQKTQKPVYCKNTMKLWERNMTKQFVKIVIKLFWDIALGYISQYGQMTAAWVWFLASAVNLQVQSFSQMNWELSMNHGKSGLIIK